MFENVSFPGLFKRFKKQKVLVIGDVMIDTYLWGHVGRVSPEAPVPIVSGVIEESRLGGAANVALNLKNMGAVPVLCSVIGDDHRGKMFLELMEEQNLGDIGLVMDRHRITTQKTRIIGGSQHLLRVDEEMDHYLSEAIQENFIELVSNLLESGGFQAMLMLDYNKGVLTPGVISRLTRKAALVSVSVMADPRTHSFSSFGEVKLFSSSYRQTIKGLKLEIRKDKRKELARAVKALQKKQGIENILVSMGEEGILVSDGNRPVWLSGTGAEINDITGYYDTLIAVSSLGLLSGLTLQESAAIASMAACQVCEKTGVMPVDAKKLKSDCKLHFISS